MTRLRYLLSLLDARDRLLVAGLLAAALLSAAGVAWTTAKHQARVDRAKDCEQRIEASAARHGLRVVKAAMPCEGAR